MLFVLKLPELLIFSLHNNIFHVGDEVYTHSTLQRERRERATHFQERESPVKLRRLTKGVSISLPSSPLLPHQTNVVLSHSCIKFPGGLNWNS